MKNFTPYILMLTAAFILLASCNSSMAEQPPTPGFPVIDSSENSSEEVPQEDSEVELKTTSQEIRERIEKKWKNTETARFYTLRNDSPAWSKPKIRTAFMEELQKADVEGLFLKDYYSDELERLLENQATLNESDTALLDILLTEAFLSFAHDLYYGKLDPNDLYKHWGVARKEKDFSQLLQKSLENEKIAKALNNLKPSHQIYKDLKTSLQEYSALKEKEEASKKIPEGDIIKAGEKDKRLPAIAQRLHELELISQQVTDSVYTGRLQEAVKTFQKEKGLQVDGIIGNSTVAELNMTAEERYEQIVTNLERWRWYPRDLGEHYILINIPQFKLAVVKEGDTVRTHNVIAGTRARQTPVFTDTLDHIVINPTWTLPPTIKTEDVIPKAARDSSYLASHNMKMYGPDGQILDPKKIDWSDPQVRHYTFVQSPGPSNPLGRVKIIYPNRYLIYLHDTPAQSLFGQNQRAESSGCVRVENAIDLSGYVLRNQKEWNEEKIRKVIASGKTEEVKINWPIQVHHFYWTTWRAGNKTVFTEDVYRLDKEVYSLLKKSN